MKAPLISVIVTVYQVKPYLAACLDSILKQTYAQFELILVNDGATDGSAEICAQYAQRDRRIKLINQANQGLSLARNRALSCARGTYLTFIDSDDYVAPDYLAYLLNLIQQQQTKLSICAHFELSPRGRLRALTAGRSRTLTTSACLKAMLNEDGFTLSACGKLYHRSLFRDVNFPAHKLHEDVGTTYRLVLQCPQIAYGAQPKYYYRQRAGSITHAEFNPRKLDLITLTDQMCADLDQALPALRSVTRQRRLRARFSILRQLPLRATAETKPIEQTLLSYLRTHQSALDANSPRRDRWALRLALIHPLLFKLAWRLYCFGRKS